MRRILAILICAFASAVPGAVPGFAESPDVGVTAALAGSAERRIPPSAVSEGPGAVLAAAAGVDSFPVGCATPLVLGIWRESSPSDTLRQAQAYLAAGPLGVDARVYTSRDGRFSIRYQSPGAAREGDAAPEMIARTAEALVAARAYLSSTMGYPDPAPGPDPVLIQLARLGHGLEGYVVPPRGGLRPTPAYMVLDTGLPADRIMPAVLHQMAHLSLLRLADADPWWHEATASFVTLVGTGDLEAERGALKARLAASSKGLAADGMLVMQGSLLWPLFLAERGGDADIVRRVWTAMAEDGLDPFEASDAVLRGASGPSPGGAFRELAIWSLFTGTRDDGAHFTAAKALPEAPMADVGPTLPLRLGPVEPVEPLGSIAFRLPAERGRGSLVFDITARGGQPGADLLVYYHGEGGRPVLVPVDLSTGSGRVSLPWSQAREVWIVLRNDARPPDGMATSFDLDASLDPVAPYDLASFTAEPSGRSIVLTWTTSVEKGMVGWNVYRAEGPSGPFSRINGVAVPAYGDAEGDTGYVFVDDGARPGRRYYYVVEGITSAGLAERSHVTSARTPAN